MTENPEKDDILFGILFYSIIGHTKLLTFKE